MSQFLRCDKNLFLTCNKLSRNSFQICGQSNHLEHSKAVCANDFFIFFAKLQKSRPNPKEFKDFFFQIPNFFVKVMANDSLQVADGVLVIDQMSNEVVLRLDISSRAVASSHELP